MKKLLQYTSLAALALSVCSCGDFLDQYSQDMVVPKTVDHLDEVLIGEVYMPSKTINTGTSQASCQFFNILDDDVNTVATKSQAYVAPLNSRYSVFNMFGYFGWQKDVRYNYDRSSYSDDNATWNDLYHRINVINIILDEIEELPHATDADNATYYRVKGESHFLRAQFFLILANLYGDAYAPATCASKLCVPLKLTPYVEYYPDADTQFQRATVKEVFDQIVTDLTASVDFLTRSPQKQTHLLHRASAEAASLLLSRVHLYMQNWDKAAEEALKVINSRNFSLAGIQTLRPDKPFLTTDNGEVIFSQGSNVIGMLNSSWSFTAKEGDYCVTADLYDLYDDDDARKTCFFNIAATDSVRLSNKYQRGITANHISDVTSLRVSEAYLNYAEACAMMSGREGDANKRLNELRLQRINGYASQNYTGDELRKQVRDERRKELCFEGHRWFDLRRYAVNESHPWSRDIIHVFNHYNDNGKFVTTSYYLLKAGDPNYTFAIPRKIIEADKVPMPDNIREDHERLKTDNDND